MCSFQLLLVLLSLFCLVSAQTDTCGNGKDNIGPLASVQYWKMTIPVEDCEFFPEKSCTIYMAFCKALTPESTLCHNETLGPTSVCVTDGTDGYSLGEENDNPFVENELHYVSPLTARFTNGSDSLCSNNAIQTDIIFTCNPLAKWESARDQDISNFFGGIIVDFADPCKVTINMQYDKICEPEVCEAGEHDINPLTRPDHWEADVHPDQCYDLTGKREKCTLYLSFCDNMKDVAGCPNSTVCIGVGNDYYRFGQYSEFLNPFALSVEETVNAMYFFGQNYSNCMHKNTNTTVLLECAPGNDWTYTDGKPDATEHLLGVLPSPLSPCLVIITMNYSGACSPAPTVSPPTASSDEGANIGWVGFGLLIGLIVIVTLYLTIGSAINIAKGNSGCPEMLPQFAFWKAFFIYVIEGVYFTADLFTCGWCSRTAGPAPSSNYDKL